MADQGDIFRAGNLGVREWFDGTIATATDWYRQKSSEVRSFLGSHTDTKKPTSVTVAITGATANAYIVLSRNGVQVTRTRADGSGAANFYDLDDSNHHLYYASEIGSAKAWSVQVANTTVTVVALTSGGGTSSFGYVG